MKYDCGHDGCDICGHHFAGFGTARRVKYGNLNFVVCDPCIGWSVNHAYQAACSLGGTIIDPRQPCPSQRAQTKAVQS